MLQSHPTIVSPCERPDPGFCASTSPVSPSLHQSGTGHSSSRGPRSRDAAQAPNFRAVLLACILITRRVTRAGAPGRVTAVESPVGVFQPIPPPSRGRSHLPRAIRPRPHGTGTILTVTQGTGELSPCVWVPQKDVTPLLVPPPCCNPAAERCLYPAGSPPDCPPAPYQLPAVTSRAWICPSRPLSPTESLGCRVPEGGGQDLFLRHLPRVPVPPVSHQTTDPTCMGDLGWETEIWAGR